MENKGEVELRNMFIVVVVLFFAFFVFDLSLTYMVVSGKSIPIIDLLPLIKLSFA